MAFGLHLQVHSDRDRLSDREESSGQFVKGKLPTL